MQVINNSHSAMSEHRVETAPQKTRRISDRGLAQIIDQVGKMSANLGFVDGLNPAQWAALRYFDQAKGGLRATVTAFATFQGTTKGTASQTVSALVRKELLERRTHPDDRRIHMLTLTLLGEQTLQGDPLNHLCVALNTLGEDEKWALAESLEKVLRNLVVSRAEL